MSLLLFLNLSAQVGAGIHVVPARPSPPRAGHVIALRAPASAPVATTLAPQIHVVHSVRVQFVTRGAVLYVRPNRASFVPDRSAPQIHVVQAPSTARHSSRDSDVLFGRNALVPAIAASSPAPAIHVLSRGRDRRPIQLASTPVLFLRQLSTPQVDPRKATPQIHVISPTVLRAAERPTGRVLYVRPSRTSLLPDRIEPQIHVLLQPRERALAPTHVVFLRNAPVPPVVPDRLTPQIHTLVQPRERALAATHVTFLRNALVPPAPFATLAPQIHVVSAVPRRASLRPDGVVLYLRPSRSSVVPAKLAPQIHVLSQVGSRTRITREPIILFLHGYIPPPTTFPRPLLVTDSSGARYLVVDDSMVRLDVEDDSDQRYGVEP